MEQPALLAALEAARSLRDFVEDQLLSRVPWIFSADPDAFSRWRQTAAPEAGLEPEAVFLVGSAATGYSLSPRKAGRPFRPIGPSAAASDIDMAIVDATMFEAVWNNIVGNDRKRALRRAGDYIARMRLDVYWGTISHSDALPGTDSAGRIRLLFAATTRQEPFVGHRVHARVYRRREDLVAYHEQSLRALLTILKTSEGIR
jgi:hypothetical protein